jgi:Uma2 family endonuclease
VVAPRSKLTAVEYLAWEREQSTKHEFCGGEVFAMAGTNPRHNALCVRLGALLDAAVGPRGCHVLSSDQRTGLDDSERYVYPDLSVVCGAPQVERDDVVTNPTVIAEQNDRGSKWQSYQQVASLTDYVVVPQWIPRLEHYRRDPRGGWSYRSVGSGDRIVLTDGTELAVDDVFARLMDLPGDPPPPGG